MAKKGKIKALPPVETVEAKAVEAAFPAKQPKPEVAPAPVVDEKALQIQALEKEVIEIAGERDPAYVVWSVKTLDGRITGTSLKYYMDCKLHEIETGTPCHFASLVGQPAQALPGALKLVAPKAKKCPTCK